MSITVLGLFVVLVVNQVQRRYPCGCAFFTSSPPFRAHFGLAARPPGGSVLRTSSSAPALVVFATGIGSRYGGLKQIEPVGPGGEAVLDFAFDAKRAGFGKFIFVIRSGIERDFRENFGRRFAKHVNVEYALQELDMVPAGHDVPPERKKPWGTGHAVFCAAPSWTALSRSLIPITSRCGIFRALARFLREVRRHPRAVLRW